MTQIVIDLYADWIALLKARLLAAGYKPAPDGESLRIAIQYFNVLLRRIEPRARVVEVANELSCPSDLKPALDEILRKAAAGESLVPHLSRRLVKTDYHDPLLNDWGLHHLHLGTNLEGDGFVERSGPLLFAKVTDDAFYAVAVLAHGCWTDETLLERILDNWPQLLAQYEAPGVSRLTAPYSPQERAEARKGNLVSPLTLSNGKVYFPPGGGVTMAGSNIRTVMQHDDVVRQLRAMEHDFMTNLEEKRAQLPPGTQFGSPPTFDLRFDPDGRLIVYEPTAKVAFRYPRS